MHGFFASFQPFFSRFKSEILLLSLACILTAISVGVFLFQQSSISENQETEHTSVQENIPYSPSFIMVDISGAVKKPNVYKLTNGARLYEIIQKAGGLLADADKSYIDRNYNFARLLTDQEKIYIPYLSDTASGIVVENKHLLENLQPLFVPSPTQSDFGPPVNVNTASAEELDEIPGIGTVQAQAIIKARPYTTFDELVSKKAIRQSVLQKIQSYITLSD